MTTLTNNFSLEEMIQSQTALRNNLDNTPNESQIENLKGLCENILQPLRDYYQSPIKVTSGFRSEKLATLIGSKPTSQHCKGEAADFEIPGYDNKEGASHIKNNFDYDQLILEYYDESDKKSKAKSLSDTESMELFVGFLKPNFLDVKFLSIL